MERQFNAKTPEEFRAAGEYIVSLMDRYTVFTLEGNLGAGKTTLVQEICRQLDCVDVVSSPSFSLINPYETRVGMIYHMDMYRILKPEEAVDFGIEEYLWNDLFCFIEWPGVIENLLPEEFVSISLDILPDTSRQLTIRTP